MPPGTGPRSWTPPARLWPRPETLLQSIATTAGVGQGTLYRHFRTRRVLILEVHRRDIADLVQSVPALLDQLTGADALQAWLHRLAQYGRVKHGLLDAVYAELHHQLDEEGSGLVVSAIGLLLRAGQDDGTLRTDLQAEDLLMLVGFCGAQTHVQPDKPSRSDSSPPCSAVLPKCQRTDRRSSHPHWTPN